MEAEECHQSIQPYFRPRFSSSPKSALARASLRIKAPFPKSTDNGPGNMHAVGRDSRLDNDHDPMKSLFAFASALVRNAGCELWFLAWATTSLAAEPVYPLKVSENRRYFVDQKGDPVFWLGTTQWQLFREYKLEEARTIIEKTKAHGFAFAQVMLLGVGDGTKPNVYGEKPWIDNNPLTPNEGYFKHVDAVVQIARENNLVISMTMFHQRYRKFITLENARAWAKWIAQRYQDVPTIVWSMTPEAKPEFLPIMRELAAGLREGDGGTASHHVQARSAPHPIGFAHEEAWLDFSCMQTWKWVEKIYPMVTQEYNLQAGETRRDGGRRLRTRLGIWVRGHAAVGSPAGVLFLPGRGLSHLWAQRQLAGVAHLEAGAGCAGRDPTGLLKRSSWSGRNGGIWFRTKPCSPAAATPTGRC